MKRVLLESGANLDILDENSLLPLYLAIQREFTEGVDLLLQCGRLADTETDFKDTSLMRASKCSFMNIVRFIVKYDESPLYHMNEDYNTTF